MLETKIKAGIFGLSNSYITDEEMEFFRQVQPLGFIIFRRNIIDKEQLKNYVAELKNLVNHDKLLIFIDQEGGRVARLRPPYFGNYPCGEYFAKIAEQDIEKGKQALYENFSKMADELSYLGINGNCAPVCDIYYPGMHDIVGDRAYGDNVEQVSILAEEVCKALWDKKIYPVIKHIPGHGRARADSHFELPIVDTSYKELSNTDFQVFRNLKSQKFAMTAHILYSAIDKDNPATMSKKMIELIRNDIGFEGLIMTDDLSMKALSGSFKERTEKSFEAGCDLVLHCNGDIKEMIEIASVLPAIDDKILNIISE